jgi:phosphocarrier protein
LYDKGVFLKELIYTIKAPIGIHARPAGLFVRKLQEFSSTVRIFRGNEFCDGKKLLALMKMQIKAGEEISLQFEGDDEDAAVAVARTFLLEHL